MTVKLAEVAVPPSVVTRIGPVVAPVGTVVVIRLDESVFTPARLVPPPETVSRTPAPPGGANPVTVGAATTVKPGDVAVPPAVVTWIGPVVAPAGTVVSIWFADTTVKIG